ncbi:hypothetical protein AWJ20_1912 [Sugiyamaella lignohabitans]|uniref:Major facilitator superfamily (MFS) profile domain-containing protein n=1 Tax=Sugiyamaella lignohabitans TaxID=796027 RepID=A0A167E3Z0_9ASCO|nr:uncharacterized protein AWJ20_1912 [Sugiyamaella lignohabitans]ANB13613.1 hypothetical protein AWJ20_1912 [Sugiyamaella lignohabitans]
MPAARKQYTFREQLIGFPWVQLAVIAAIRFAEPISFTSLFPYIYFMVKSFLTGKSDNEVGRYAGYISGMFALCQCMTGILWGRMSDKYGRKKVILTGLFGSAFSLLLFGFSTNFYMAMFARCMAGLLNGNVGVVRTVIGEIAVHRQHQALAFSIMPLLWQVGCVIGPMVGGFLANPVGEHPDWFDGGDHKGGFFSHDTYLLFSDYPFLLPNIVVSSILIIGWSVAFFFLDETHPERKYDYDFGRVIGRRITALIFPKTWFASPSAEEWSTDDSKVITPSSSSEDVSILEGEQQPLLGPGAGPDNGTIEENPTKKPAQARTLPEVDQSWGAVLVPQVKKLLVCAFFLALHTVVYEELLPIYLSTSIQFDTPNQRGPFPGGLGLDSREVGLLLSLCGAFGIFLMIFVYPNIDRIYGTLRPYRFFIKGHMFVYFTVPFFQYLLRLSHQAMFNIICVVLFIRTMFNSMSYPGLLLLVNRSAADKRHLGVINGCTQVVSASARAIGPIIWGYFMSTGQAIGHVELPFWLLSVVAAMGALYSSTITDDEDSDDEEEEV